MTKKFRVWDKQDKSFLSKEYLKEFKVSISWDGETIHQDFWVGTKTIGKDVIVQQWTGLTDSQGVEIYEGDIVEYKISGYKYRDLVFYEGCSFKSGPLDKSSSSPLEGINVIGLIIGNILEKP